MTWIASHLVYLMWFKSMVCEMFTNYKNYIVIALNTNDMGFPIALNPNSMDFFVGLITMT